MLKVLLIILSFSFPIGAIAQSTIPTIRATADRVDIRVGDDYFSKAGWVLEPNKNPDVFSIGSKWHYSHKRVTFITDIDSISFDVQPGSKHDFIILKQNIPCHIQIFALNDPALMQPPVLIPLLFGFSIFVILLGYYWKRINGRAFLLFGYCVVILFWLMTLTSGYIHGNYNHLKNTISELGAIGTKSELFTSASLVLLAMMNILFCVGFYKVSRARGISRTPSILSFAMPVSMIWAALFTLGNEFHSLIGFIPFLIIVGSILCYFLWKRKPDLLGLRTTSLIAFAIMLLILSRFINPFGHEYEGLVQRFFYLGWTTWTVGTCYYLLRRR